MTKETSNIISFLRFPLTVMVVLIHCFGAGECRIGDIQWDAFSAWNAYDIIRVTMKHVICQIAVPAFFLMSGYLFFQKLQDKWDWSIWKRKIRSRVFTLLIPYLVWNVLLWAFSDDKKITWYKISLHALPHLMASFEFYLQSRSPLRSFRVDLKIAS